MTETEIVCPICGAQECDIQFVAGEPHQCRQCGTFFPPPTVGELVARADAALAGRWSHRPKCVGSATAAISYSGPKMSSFGCSDYIEIHAGFTWRLYILDPLITGLEAGQQGLAWDEDTQSDVETWERLGVWSLGDRVPGDFPGVEFQAALTVWANEGR